MKLLFQTESIMTESVQESAKLIFEGRHVGPEKSEKFRQSSQMKTMVFKHLEKCFIHKKSTGKYVQFLCIKHIKALDLLASRGQS